MTAKDRLFGHMFAAALVALTLTACAGGNDDTAARFLVAPGKYVLFNCQQLAQEATLNMARQHELEGLMAQAGTGSGGQLVSSVAYRPEYLTLHGEMADMRRVAADKNCKFAPGEEAGATAASGGANR
jgi:hypothetical protein